MSDNTGLEVHIDDSAKDVELFKSLKRVTINKTELFKYAIWMWEVPSHIKESDFDYLQSKVPSLEAMVTDFISLTPDSIESHSKDDRVKKIVSEAVGVGIGLKYTVDVLNTNPNRFKKIAPAVEGKYLDYSTIHDKKEYEIETKGTVSPYYTTFKKDILAKKADAKKKVHLRFGTITMIKNSSSSPPSKCVIVDDPPEDIPVQEDDTFKTQLMGYGAFLSYILDSKYYNKYIKPLKQNKVDRVAINESKFFGKYSFAGKTFYGECFDYRLIGENIEEVDLKTNGRSAIFNHLTQRIGRTKFFIGLDTDVVEAINQKDKEFLTTYESGVSYIEEENLRVLLDRDGILIVKSRDGADSQLEKLFPEEEVLRRLGLHTNYIKGIAHKCGAPCRSREKQGKPCEIMTFRQNCHFHR